MRVKRGEGVHAYGWRREVYKSVEGGGRQKRQTRQKRKKR